MEGRLYMRGKTLELQTNSDRKMRLDYLEICFMASARRHPDVGKHNNIRLLNHTIWTSLVVRWKSTQHGLLSFFFPLQNAAQHRRRATIVHRIIDDLPQHFAVRHHNNINHVGETFAAPWLTESQHHRRRSRFCLPSARNSSRSSQRCCSWLATDHCSCNPLVVVAGVAATGSPQAIAAPTSSRSSRRCCI